MPSKKSATHLRWTSACALSLLIGCGGDQAAMDVMPDGGGENPGTAQIETHSPLCTQVAGGANGRELFPFAIIDPNEVSDAIPLGNMEPDSPQEVLNHEIGFYVPGIAVPLTSPTTLYVESIRRSFHSYDSVTDWGIAFHVCSYDDGEVRRAAVLGNFAHMSSISEPLQAFFDAEFAKLDAGEASAMNCNEDASECGVNMNSYRDLIGDEDWTFTLAGGAALGTAGKLTEQANGPAGLDTNLQDRRINDFAGNYYINPTRLGGEEGPGHSWRYGTCFYDYFAEPFRTQYMDEIRVFGENRVSASEPCGSMEVDRGAEGTVRGIWASVDIADQAMSSEFSGAEIDIYLEKTAVLGDHFTSPDTHMIISTPLDVLSDWGGGNSNIVIERATEESLDYQNAVNVSFKDTTSGTIYCYEGERFGGFEKGYYLVEVSADDSQLTIERVDASCAATPPGSRAFDSGSDAHFVMVR